MTKIPYNFIVGRNGEVYCDDRRIGPDRYRPTLVHPRGRWRSRKQAIRELAEDLGYPECLEVAHDDQIVGAVMQAGLRLRDWRRFRRSGRRCQERARLMRAAKSDLRWARRILNKSEDPPF